jgi:hypothetical protein
MNFRGEWLFCADYQPGEVVKAGGQYFMAAQQSAGKDPQDPLNSAYWYQLGGNVDIPDHNDLDGVQGGDATNKYHLTEDAAKAAEAANNPSENNPMATMDDIPVIPDHNGLTGVQGGDGSFKGHLTEDAMLAAEAANSPSETNPFATMAEIKPHNELEGLQGGDVVNNEFYHLKKKEHDGAAYANDPHKWNPFLTKKDLPQFSKTISPFTLAPMPAGTGMLYGSDFGDGTGGEKIHLAVGDSCAVFADAADPMTWTLDLNVPAGYWRSVAFGGLDIFVAVGLEGKAMWRDLAGNWSLLPVLGGDWAKIVYGNGMFVAVGDGAVMKSLDGKTGWTLKNVDPGYGKDITFDNGFFYIVGKNGMKKSADAETWTTVPLGTDATWRTASAGGGGHIIALGGKCVRSHDGGATWAERRLPVGGWEESCYTSDFFIAVDGIDSYIYTEAARIHWEKRDMPNFAIRGLSSGEDTIIAVGSRILVARVIDTGAALLNANGPNGSNPFATIQDVTDGKNEAITEAVAQAKLYWGGTI